MLGQLPGTLETSVRERAFQLLSECSVGHLGLFSCFSRNSAGSAGQKMLLLLPGVSRAIVLLAWASEGWAAEAGCLLASQGPGCIVGTSQLLAGQQEGR